MKIMILTPSFPYPPDTGAAIRIYNIVRYLSLENEIHLVSLVDDKTDDAAISEMTKYCAGLQLIRMEKIPKILQVPKVVRKFVHGLPFMLKYAESDELEKVLQNISSKDNIDIIQFEHSYMAHNVRYLPQGLACKTVISFHNIASAQYYRIYKMEKRLFNKLKHFMEWVPMFRWESRIAEQFDKSVVVSDIDRYLLKFLNPMIDISVIPNGVDAKGLLPYPRAGRQRNLLFVGTMDYEPNGDAVLYFCRHVFPLVKKVIPEAKFIVVGRNPPPEVKRLAKDREIVVTGRVDDIKPYYQEAMLVVVPLRSGGGTRLKILEAMSTGTPVVSTSLGCEGIDVQDGRNILIANSPELFAEKVRGLMLDESAWSKVSQEGRRLVEQRYDWESIASSLQDVYRGIAPPGSQPT